MNLLWFAIALIGSIVLFRVADAFGLSAVTVVAALLLALLALMVPAGIGMSKVLTSMFFGVLVAALVGVIAAFLTGRGDSSGAEPEDAAEASPEVEEADAPDADADEDASSDDRTGA